MKAAERKNGIDLQVLIYCILSIVIPLFVVKNFTHEPSTGKHLIYVIGLGIILFLFSFEKKKLEFKFSFAHLAFFGMALSALLSLINVYLDNPTYLPYSLDVGVYMILLALSALYISTKFNTRTKIELAMLFFVAGALVVALDAMLNYYIGFDIFLGKVGTPFARASARSTIGNPNFVSDYMGMTIPMVIYFLGNPRAFGEVFKKPFRDQLILKIVMIACLIPMVSAVFIAETRTVLTGITLGNIIFLTAFFSLRKRTSKYEIDEKVKRLTLVFVIVAVLITAILSFLYLTPSFVTGQGKLNVTARLEYALTSSNSWKERFSAWWNSYYQWRDDSNKLRLVFGSGIGSFQLYHLLYSPEVMASHPEYMTVWNNFKRTHNDYIQGLGEMGILGFIMIILLLIFMVWRYFRVLFRIKDRENLLMYGALGAGIFSLALHTMFEFPLHMQPNIMLGIFIISIAMGSYFNQDLKKITIRRTFFIVPLVFLIGFSGYSKLKAYLGEGYFRQGQIEQQYYYAYQGEIAKFDTSKLQSLLSEINNLTGNYAYLKELQTYMNVKGVELKKKYPNLNERDFIAAVERERQNEIVTRRGEITNAIATSEKYESIANQYYENAVNKFMKSIDIYPAFGKPLWYLAGFSTKPGRIDAVLSIDEMMEVLIGEDPYARAIIDKFSGNQSIIPLPEAEIRTLPFKSFVEDNYQVLKTNSEAANKLNLRFLSQLQFMYDAVDYYESSIITFSERQTPRLIGRLESMIEREMKKYHSYILSVKDDLNGTLLNVDGFVDSISHLISKSADSVEYWYKLAVTLLPGTWSRYPDWEFIYAEYMDIVAAASLNSNSVPDKLIEIAKLHAIACEAMATRYLVIPNEAFNFAYKYFKTELAGESSYIEFLERLLEVYKPIYEIDKEKLDEGIETSQEKLDRLTSFVNQYLKVEEELTFLK